MHWKTRQLMAVTLKTARMWKPTCCGCTTSHISKPYWHSNMLLLSNSKPGTDSYLSYDTGEHTGRYHYIPMKAKRKVQLMGCSEDVNTIFRSLHKPPHNTPTKCIATVRSTSSIEILVCKWEPNMQNDWQKIMNTSLRKRAEMSLIRKAGEQLTP